jgi:DNA-3-methyladenine glycosylase I
MVAYHDEDWGVPTHDDRALFELLTLEGAQAGLSWLTILRKREGYRRAFSEFDPARVARFGVRDQKRLMADTGIVRNRAKIESTISNAAAVLAIQRDHGSLSDFLWAFVGGTPVQNRWRLLADVPAQTELSTAMSKELKRQGFRFVGPTTVYAFLQAAGFVNDHTVPCFRWKELTGPPTS